MRKLFALLISVLLVAGCVQSTELGQVPSSGSKSEPKQTEESAADENVEPEQSPSFELSTLREEPEVCKIEENSAMRQPGDPVPDYSEEREIRNGKYPGNATAFPFSPTTLPIYGELHVSVIPVDWEDSEGTPEDMARYKKEIQTLVDFWYMVSEGSLNLVIDMPDEWFRIPGSVVDFQLTEEDEGQRYETRPKKQALYDAIITAADSSMDFTQTEVAIPIWPTGKTVSFDGGPHEFNFDWNAFMETDEGNIYDIAGAGDWFLDHPEYGGPWFYWAHEMGHMLGFVHLPYEGDKYNDLDWREYFWQQNGVNGFDVMGNQDGAIKTIGSWLRWMAGWVRDSQVICLTEDMVEDEVFALNHLNEIGVGTKAVVVKLSDTEVVVIESRRWDARFDRQIAHSRDGLVAYVVDATKAASENSQMLISPRDITRWVEVNHWRGSEELDANFCEGDTAQVANLRIEALSLQEGTDYVRISKVENYVDPLGPPAGSTVGRKNTIENGCVFSRDSQ